MYKRILVAVDDMPVSKLALKEAARLARDQKAKLCVTFVADEFLPVSDGTGINFKKHDAEIRKKSKAFLKKMSGLIRSPKISVKEHLIEITEPGHNVAAALAKFAKKWRADLIVLGTGGRRGLKRLLFGSVSDELILQASVPVHVVRSLKQKPQKTRSQSKAKKRSKTHLKNKR